MAKESKTKKVLKYGAVGLVSAIVGVGATGLTIDTQADDVALLNQKVADLNQNISSLDSQIVDKDNLIAELEAVEPVVEIEYKENPINQELLDSFDFLAEFPELSEAILDDLDDDEGELIPARIALLKDVHAKFVDYIKEELADELDKEEFYNVTFDEDDVEKIKVYDDLEDIESFEANDWKEKDFDIALKVKVEHDDEDYKFIVSANYDADEFEDFEIAELEE